MFEAVKNILGDLEVDSSGFLLVSGTATTSPSPLVTHLMTTSLASNQKSTEAPPSYLAPCGEAASHTHCHHCPPAHSLDKEMEGILQICLVGQNKGLVFFPPNIHALRGGHDLRISALRVVTQSHTFAIARPIQNRTTDVDLILCIGLNRGC
ncbi:hypothetical protein E2C01_023156 [Portunus trituberculatus]|uniref:Uncharacterized protein n=1 Tax=Portunus trituberculatus TaxID=210409 RepID=A0A5B7EAT3_PORTR|nr:hypothetical protein [Portunus trituberculatus]